MSDRDVQDQLSELVQGDLSEKNLTFQWDQSVDSFFRIRQLHVGRRLRTSCDPPCRHIRFEMDYNQIPSP